MVTRAPPLSNALKEFGVRRKLLVPLNRLTSVPANNQATDVAPVAEPGAGLVMKACVPTISAHPCTLGRPKPAQPAALLRQAKLGSSTAPRSISFPPAATSDVASCMLWPLPAGTCACTHRLRSRGRKQGWHRARGHCKWCAGQGSRAAGRAHTAYTERRGMQGVNRATHAAGAVPSSRNPFAKGGAVQCLDTFKHWGTQCSASSWACGVTSVGSTVRCYVRCYGLYSAVS